MDVFKIYMKLFFKNPTLKYLYLCMLLSTIAILGISIFMGSTLSTLLYSLCLFIFFEMVLFMIMSYIFLTRDRVNHISETIEAISKRESHQTYFIVVLGTLLVIFDFILMVLMLMYSQAIDLSSTYITSFLSGIIIPEVIVLMIVSYSYLNKDKSEIVDDISYDKSYHHYAIAVLGLLLVIYDLITIILLVIALIFNTGFMYFSGYYIISFLMNIVLPEIICFMIAIMLSIFDNIFISSIIMVISILLMSPLMAIIQSRMINFLRFIPETIPFVNQFFHIIMLPFSLFMNIGYDMDQLYSYNNEIYKLWMLLGWFIIFLLVYYHHYWFKKRRMFVLLVVIIGLCSINIYKSQSIYRNLYDSYENYEDYLYYMQNNNDITIYNNENIDYMISEYDLNITIKEQLYVEGTLHLKADQTVNTIILTLYHNYQIKNISSSHLTSYKQDGDYVTLMFDSYIHEEDIIISYSGYHHTMFSNYEAMQLAGYFPWYPMAGEKTVYFYNSDIASANDGLNPYNRIKEAVFYISVNAPYEVICNLDEVSTHTYKGISDSLTLIGGNVGYTDNQIVNYYPVELSIQYTLDDYQNDIYTKIENLKIKYQDLFQVELTDFDNKNIILASDALFRQTNSGYLSIFDNYILVNSDALDYMSSYINYKLYNRFDVNPILVDVLSSLDYDILNHDTFIDELILEINYIYSTCQNSTLEENIIQGKYCEELLDDLNHYIDAYGKEALAQELGKVILGGDYEVSYASFK